MRKNTQKNTREPQKSHSIYRRNKSDRDVIVRLLAKLLAKKWVKEN